MKRAQRLANTPAFPFARWNEQVQAIRQGGMDVIRLDIGNPDLDFVALAEADRPLLVGVGPAPERLVWEALDVAEAAGRDAVADDLHDQG